MSPELLHAVKERIDLGYSDDQIKEELTSAGYDEIVISEVIREAKGGTPVPVPPQHSNEVSGRPSSLPGVFDLLNTAFKAAFARVDLIFALVVPVALISISAFFLVEGDPNLMQEDTTFWAVNLIGNLVYIVLVLSAVYIVSNSKSRNITISEGVSWVKGNGFGLIWVGMLTGFVVWGGFVLLWIPGIIVSVYLILSQVVFAKEGLRGLDALMRSRELVYGNWRKVALLLLGSWLLIFLILFVVFFALGIFGPAFIEESSSYSFLVLGIANSILETILTLVGLNMMLEIYTSLAKTRPVFNREESMSTRTKYKVLAWLGPLVIVLFVLMAIVLASLNSAREQAVGAQRSIEKDVEQLFDSLDAKERAADLKYE